MHKIRSVRAHRMFDISFHPGDAITFIKERYTIFDYKFDLVILVLAISAVGVLMVGSTAPNLWSRQLFGVILGIVAMVILSLFSYRWIMKLYWPLYILNMVLLIAVHFFGQNVGGATRWLNIGFVQFQPSDLTKIIIIIFYAQFIQKNVKHINNWKTIAQAVALILPSLFLVFRQPNLSNTIAIGLLFCTLIYLGGLSYKIIAGILAVIIPVATIFLAIAVQPNQTLIQGYQQRRILAWLNPEEHATGDAFQQLNSIMAIGSGQLTGKGFNTDSTDSMKNGNFVPEPQTDFIFAIIGEELGFVGCVAVIHLLLLIVIKCFRIGMKSQDLAGRVLCGGVGAILGIQTFINIAVVTLIFPNTGISLPFVSYGLTSVICFYMGIGIVLNVGLQSSKYT